MIRGSNTDDLHQPSPFGHHGTGPVAIDPRRIYDKASSTPGFRIGVAIFLLLALAAALYPELSGLDPTKMNVRARLLPPLFIGETWSFAHPLGTDQIGRDMLVRSLVGLRYSFLIGVSSVVVMLMIGCVLGTLAGYFGGRTDAVIMRLTDAQLSIPMIILAISVLGVSRPTIPAIILVLGLSIGRSMPASCAAL